jgi:Leucine-rich repeat (LRR) protein
LYYVDDLDAKHSIKFARTDGLVGFSGQNAVEVSLAPLCSMPVLQHLFMTRNKVTAIDLSPLSSCRNLASLDLSDNRISLVDLSPLKPCKYLKEVNLAGNEITTLSLSPLSECLKLRELNLSRNELRSIDLRPLSRCRDLMTLDLSSNYLSRLNLSPLKKCRRLERLLLTGNDFEDIKVPLEDLPRLKEVIVDSHCAVQMNDWAYNEKQGKVTQNGIHKNLAFKPLLVPRIIDDSIMGHSSFLQLREMLDKVSGSEHAYLEEAVGCIESGFLRAAVVMGWAGAVARMQAKIAAMGFDKFNTISEILKKERGVYSQFDRVYSVKSLNAFRAKVSDRTLLMTLLCMEAIDVNQHDRLKHCYTLRNNSAHPGKAPIKEANVVSFFSDLVEIVYSNPALDS